MSVLAIIAALVIEQWRPLGERKSLQGTLAAWATWLEQSFNGGERKHGVTAWLVAVLPPALLALAIYLLLYSVHPLLALVFNVAVLYLTLGFRQFSHYFTDIQLAIKSGDIDRARTLLDQWRGASGVVRTREELIRLSIEEALLASHRHVFGVLLWYLLLPGPTGAIVYRLAAYFAGRWQPLGGFGDFANRVFHVLDWPAASTMGVRLGMPVQDVDGMQPRPELGVGDPAEGPFLDSTVGLLWRALVVWVFAVLILTVVRLL